MTWNEAMESIHRLYTTESRRRTLMRQSINHGANTQTQTTGCASATKRRRPGLFRSEKRGCLPPSRNRAALTQGLVATLQYLRARPPRAVNSETLSRRGDWGHYIHLQRQREYRHDNARRHVATKTAPCAAATKANSKHIVAWSQEGEGRRVRIYIGPGSGKKVKRLKREKRCRERKRSRSTSTSYAGWWCDKTARTRVPEWPRSSQFAWFANRHATNTP